MTKGDSCDWIQNNNYRMESEKTYDCGFCDNPNALKKCGKSHTRHKETRFCNKTCEAAAHSKERKTEVTANENPGDESLKNAIESEMKRLAKKERKQHQNIIRSMNRPEGCTLVPDQLRILQGMTRSANSARNNERRGVIISVRVPQSPEDGTQDQN